MVLQNIIHERNGWGLNLNLWWNISLLTINKTHKKSGILDLEVIDISSNTLIL